MVKVLVCGDVSHDPVHYASKLASLQRKSGPFSCILLTQSPLPPPHELDLSTLPKVKFPVPTFFASQATYDTESIQAVHENLHFVGAAKAVHLDGLTILLLADGFDDPTQLGEGKKTATHASENGNQTWKKRKVSTSNIAWCPDDVAAALRDAGAINGPASFRGVDILITTATPSGIAFTVHDTDAVQSKGQSESEDGSHGPRSLMASRLALQSRPRYIFCRASAKSVLTPFVIPPSVHGTRVIGLPKAPMRSGSGQKKGGGSAWVYAADVQPLAQMSVQELSATRATPELPCPLKGGAMGHVGSGFPNDRGGSNPRKKARGSGNDVRHRSQRNRPSTSPDAQCWFCLATGKDPHLVLSIGRVFYIALAKGGIVPHHMLIVSIDHTRHSLEASLGLTDPDSVASRELRAMKEAIRAFFATLPGNCVPYLFERVLRTRGGDRQQHMHMHCIPVSVSEDSVFWQAKGSDRSKDTVEVQAGISKGVSRTSITERQSRVADTEVAQAGLAIGLQTGQDCGVKLDVVPRDRDVLAELRQRFCDRPVERAEYFWAELPGGARVMQMIDSNVDDTLSDVDAHTPHNSHAEVDGRAVGTGDGLAKDASSQSRRVDTRHSRHPLWFGRTIAARMLSLPRRVDWKLCVGNEKEERAVASRIQGDLAAFVREIEDAASDGEASTG